MPIPLDPGKLYHAVTIQAPTNTRDADGQPIPSWAAITDGTDVPAEVLQVSGGERIRGRQMEAEATVLVTIRYRASVTPQCRIVHGSRELYIVRIDENRGRREWLEIQCGEVAVGT